MRPLTLVLVLVGTLLLQSLLGYSCSPIRLAEPGSASDERP